MKAIPKADFLQHCGLLVTIKNHRLIDRLTSISVKGSRAHGPFLDRKTLSDSSPYYKLLNQFSSLTNCLLPCD
ncbi:hypothetical protein TNCT_183981 [Trichonephila clavata]|uniref:Uncharacterized protein n=1 Tax=Trichonephila clavata TaxID=2740835 RepID=A0A8X6FM21_TRICU|nr:hypothetical protein TNCT_183981 [Trichonephila clavata]